MRKNLSSVVLGSQALVVKSVNSSQNSRKVEGFDKCQNSQTFTDKIHKIKNRGKKDALQEQYVKGLQDEIHYLEMELKLLKEKEIAKHSQVDQLETFFGDGVAINENILALKNGFNAYKTQMQKRIQNLESEKRQREDLITSLSAKIDETAKLIHQQQKRYKNELTSQSDVTHEKIKSEVLLKQQMQFQQQNLKKVKTENRKMAQLLANMQRAKELLLITILRNDNHKYTRLQKLREAIVEQEIQLQQLGKNYQEVKRQDDEKSFVINLQENNIKMKKKIISLEKQLNSLYIKSEEKKMELDAKLKERHKEINARLDMQKRLDFTKDAIQSENNMSIEDIQRAAREKEVKILEAIIDKNKKLTKYADYYGGLLSRVEEKLYEHGEKKPTLKAELHLYQAKIKQMQKIVEVEKSTQCNLRAELAGYQSIFSHAKQIVPPMVNDIKRFEDKLKSCKVERERLLEDIKLKEKQVELIEILKSLNLEEVQISSSSNASIQDRLVDFMKNWELLNRN